LTEALQSIAASNMIIAVSFADFFSIFPFDLLTVFLSHQVSLTGVLMLQGAQGYADRPTTVDKPIVPSTGVFPASTTAPVPSNGETNPEKGLHET